MSNTADVGSTIESLQYRNLYFGLSDSRNEALQDSEAFLRTYVDLNDSVRTIVSGSKFMVLGPKGTGKSALAWYLQAAEQHGDHLTLVRDASNLPLAEIPRLQTGQLAGPERTVVAWKFILLCTYLELLLRDESVKFSKPTEVRRISRILRDYGFTGDTSGRALLKYSTSTVSIPIPKLGQIYKRESQSALNIFNLLPYLEEWVSTAQSNVRHVVLLDGLDSIFLNDSKYDESLAALVQACYTLNQTLRDKSASGCVVLLLRNDIFSRISLSLPDSQKMRDDLSIDLDWRVLSGEAGRRAPLMKLVNAKAGRAAGRDIEVLDYFPAEAEVHAKQGAIRRFPTFQYLLNMTRHTPRDLLRLFDEIRKVEASGLYGEGGSPLSQEVIREGVLQYSTKYFVGAISNEFAGYDGGPESAKAALTALKSMNRQRFDRSQFMSALREASPEANDPDSLLKLLFFAGAIGNSVGGIVGDKSYMQFYHRRDDAEIYLGGTFILHNALIHGWGTRRSGGAPSEVEGARRNRQRRRGGGGRAV